MTEITLNVDEKLFRKLQTLAMLTGTRDLEGFILEDVDRVVSRRIAALLGIDTPSLGPQSPTQDFGYCQPPNTLSSESIPLEDDSPPKRTAPAPTASHVLSMEDIRRDEQVEDPEHEAVSSEDDETTFDDLLRQGGLSSEPIPEEDEDDDDEGVNPFDEIISLDDIPPKRVGARKLPKGLRARAASYDGTPVNPERE